MKSCKQIMQLASDGLDKKLSLWDRLSLAFHLKMCCACREAAKMLRTIHCRASACCQSDDQLAPNECLSEQSRMRIILELQKEKDEAE